LQSAEKDAADSSTKLQADEKDTADVSTKRPADEGAASLNATEVLILHRRLKMIQQRAAEANKDSLEAEKERDDWDFSCRCALLPVHLVDSDL
jgi:hypothetical protein